MTISLSRGREKKLRRDGTEKKREQKKDWTKKKIKEITEAVQKMTDDEFDGLEESLRLTLKSRGQIPECLSGNVLKRIKKKSFSVQQTWRLQIIHHLIKRFSEYVSSIVNFSIVIN